MSTSTASTTNDNDNENQDQEDKKKVFVFNFPPVPHVYSICPFGLKLESFCRINEIPHETIWTTNVSKYGTLPYCRFGDKETGEEIPDSNLSLDRLKQEFRVSEDAVTVSAADRALTHLIVRMLEEHTAQIGFYYRYGLEVPKFVESLEIEDRFCRPVYAQGFLHGLPDAIKDKALKRGIARHPEETIWKFSFDDLQALSDLLGDDKTYFLGGESPTLADCAVFGHLAQFLWIPMDFPQKQYLKEHCPNLVQFMEHFRARVWPDWEELCNTKHNDKYAHADADADTINNNTKGENDFKLKADKKGGEEKKDERTEGLDK
ncbi:Failed axon connections homolog [Seminavis robusta]|uniref:Failed axon connections homolog n=1 Tax=Seminavis robusta TaxID=568900 RepID=A0A9N8DZL7_9STRA|nr:Failed axon connections homolog [Seminavis robusta]|eukprot:Sro505_g156100.1 Failed axon connections homolog (319) ;mRNA; r:10307-11263